MCFFPQAKLSLFKTSTIPAAEPQCAVYTPYCTHPCIYCMYRNQLCTLYLFHDLFKKKYKYFMETDLEKAAFYLIFHMLTFQISSAEMNSYYSSLKCLSELPA